MPMFLGTKVETLK